MKSVILLILLVLPLMSRKRKEDLGKDTCGAKCPKCGADPGCAKSWTHTIDNTEHWCMNCGNQWK
jgi:hypothetical protein